MGSVNPNFALTVARWFLADLVENRVAKNASRLQGLTLKIALIAITLTAAIVVTPTFVNSVGKDSVIIVETGA